MVCSIDSELKLAVERFVDAVDRSDATILAETYSSEFRSIHVADESGLAELTSEQILSILKAMNGRVGLIPVLETTIHHAETAGDAGFVLMTRVKDLGDGWQPVFSSLVWRKDNGKWLLQREFVHQKSFQKLS